MQYNDPLYGPIEFPDYIGELMESSLLQRLKDISQGVLPQRMVTWPLASRFEHCVGVCHLMNLALKKRNSKQYEKLLLISALLHDAGNPALSHLCEPFLRKLTGKDGESFLENTISKLTSLHIFDSLGITSEQIVKVVTGNDKPLSVVLNGSMDVDNLDNVGRYWFVRSGGEKLFDAEFIASSFHALLTDGFIDSEWMLKSVCLDETKKWQQARGMVYGKIYGEPDLNGAMMIYRAVYLAQELGEITENFFHLSDTQAIEYLLSCNEWSVHLARRTVSHDWYKMIYSVETTEPSSGLLNVAKLDASRVAVANYICEQLKVPKGMVCAYTGRGKDLRKITLPFIHPGGSVTYDPSDPKPIYRFKVYIDPDYLHKAESVKSLAEYMIS